MRIKIPKMQHAKRGCLKINFEMVPFSMPKNKKQVPKNPLIGVEFKL